jgi:hypothetical protein
MSANSSLFAQLLQLVPQPLFRKTVRDEGGERYAKGFTCRMQLVAMLYLQLAHAKSLAKSAMACVSPVARSTTS